MFLAFTLAEKGAPPFVRYFSIFPSRHSRIAVHSLPSPERHLPRPPRGVRLLSLFPDLQLSTFDFQPSLSSTPFSCNTYGSPRKCCKQKTYGTAKPFRCNTYKKHRGPFDVRRADDGYGSIPFIFFILQAHRHNGLESSPLQSIRCARFSSRRRVYPPFLPNGFAKACPDLFGEEQSDQGALFHQSRVTVLPRPFRGRE